MGYDLKYCDENGETIYVEIKSTSGTALTFVKIFLNDEHDTEYSNTVYEQYVQHIRDIENGLTELRLKADVADGKEKKELKKQIKDSEESVEAMKIARKNLFKYKSSFEDESLAKA